MTTDERADCAVELRGVSFSYGRQTFIRDLSASFRRGAVTSIVGANGCGKSTMVKLMDGELRPQAGRVLLDGEDVRALGARERARRLAVLAQAIRPPAMTAEALVACGRYPHRRLGGSLSREDRRIVDLALSRADVARFRHVDVRRLSGGERQRVLLAMALAQEARVLVLDEPTTYLDMRACHEIMRLVRRLNAEQDITAIMVLHDLDLALRYSDRMLVMERGRVACAGTVDEVLRDDALERAFGLRVRPCDLPEGRSYALFPQS